MAPELKPMADALSQGLVAGSLLGVPSLLALVTLLATRRRPLTPRQVLALSTWLIVLLGWQSLALFLLGSLATLGGGLAPGVGGFSVAIGGGFAGLVLIGWHAGRRICRSRAPGEPAVFDPRRSAALFAASYALAFLALSLGRNPRSPSLDHLKDWLPVWASVPVPLAVAAGLWQRRRAVWWIGVAFATVSLGWLPMQPDFVRRFTVWDAVFSREPLAPLLAMLFALLLPGARTGCTAERSR